jgi:ribosomal protein S18 acetylase RimI-like enzyme
MISIRCATSEDADLLARLHGPIQQLHADARPDIYKPVSKMDALIEDYRQALTDPNNYVWIAEIGGEPVGCVIAQVMRRPETIYTHPREMVRIDQISVNPEHQGMGYGKALLNAVLERARAEGIQRVVLDVWDFNRHAIEFYERQGFRAFSHEMELAVE